MRQWRKRASRWVSECVWLARVCVYVCVYIYVVRVYLDIASAHLYVYECVCVSVCVCVYVCVHLDIDATQRGRAEGRHHLVLYEPSLQYPYFFLKKPVLGSLPKPKL